MTETRAQYALPDLAVEQPTAELELNLLNVNGGVLTFKTDCAYILGLLRDGLGDLTDGDLTRIADLYHAVTDEVRERKGDLRNLDES